MNSKPLSQIIELPGTSLNEKLVPANDNYGLIPLSRENFEAESILASHDDISSSKSPLLIVTVFCFLLAIFLLALFAAWDR